MLTVFYVIFGKRGKGFALNTIFATNRFISHSSYRLELFLRDSHLAELSCISSYLHRASMISNALLSN